MAIARACPARAGVPARRFSRRQHMSDAAQAIAGLLSHQQAADLTSARQM
ncbi:hypothetical protein [Streptomyces sp. YGL11-2]